MPIAESPAGFRCSPTGPVVWRFALGGRGAAGGRGSARAVRLGREARPLCCANEEQRTMNADLKPPIVELRLPLEGGFVRAKRLAGRLALHAARRSALRLQLSTSTAGSSAHHASRRLPLEGGFVRAKRLAGRLALHAAHFDFNFPLQPFPIPPSAFAFRTVHRLPAEASTTTGQGARWSTPWVVLPASSS